MFFLLKYIVFLNSAEIIINPREDQSKRHKNTLLNE